LYTELLLLYMDVDGVEGLLGKTMLLPSVSYLGLGQGACDVLLWSINEEIGNIVYSEKTTTCCNFVINLCTM